MSLRTSSMSKLESQMRRSLLVKLDIQEEEKHKKMEFKNKENKKRAGRTAPRPNKTNHTSP